MVAFWDVLVIVGAFDMPTLLEHWPMKELMDSY